MKKTVEESAAYDNFMNSPSQVEKRHTLADVLDDVDIEEDTPEWMGMPDYTNSQAGTGVEVYKQINVRFRNKADYDEFAKLVQQGLSPKTKTIWYPKDNRTKNSLMMWIEE